MDQTDYLLPDGTKIKLGSEKYMAPEILFKPELIGLEYPCNKIEILISKHYLMLIFFISHSVAPSELDQKVRHRS